MCLNSLAAKDPIHDFFLPITDARPGFADRVFQRRKTFGGDAAVHRIYLEMGDGESAALLGANGAGKSTTILTVLGVTAPDGGEIEVIGKPMREKRKEILSHTNFETVYITLPDGLKLRERHYASSQSSAV